MWLAPPRAPCHPASANILTFSVQPKSAFVVGCSVFQLVVVLVVDDAPLQTSSLVGEHAFTL